MGRFKVRDADKHRDGHRVLTFRCWTGDEDFDPWVREVQEYVQMIMLKHARHVLLFETDDGELAGISAFNLHDVRIGRRRVAGWFFEVIALALAWQRQTVDADIEGCEPTMKASEYVLRATFRRMLELDPRRTLVEAKVHHDNRASMKACERVGLDRHGREEKGYWPMFGEVDPAAGPTQ